jgi:tRNA pseudouridine32 synthase / 23S rRNA pseudouridine746 synthase
LREESATCTIPQCALPCIADVHALPTAPRDLPPSFPSPFDRSAIHPLAQHAASDTIAALERSPALHATVTLPDGGKMFGVLVVQAADGAVGYLRAFSGMLAGAWIHDGWAPPVFDDAARTTLWEPSEREMRLQSAARATIVATATQHADATLADFDSALAARSRSLLAEMQHAYRFSNARGEDRSLRDLFAPAEPPGGAGDCAAPKLLAEAYRRQLRPVALAEFWGGGAPRCGVVCGGGGWFLVGRPTALW